MKHQNKSQRKEKKSKEYKTIEERALIAQQIKARFQELGLDIDTYEPLLEIKNILLEYSESPSLVSGFSGRLYIEELKRYVEYRLPIIKHSLELLKLSVH